MQAMAVPSLISFVSRNTWLEGRLQEFRTGPTEDRAFPRHSWSELCRGHERRVTGTNPRWDGPERQLRICREARRRGERDPAPSDSPKFGEARDMTVHR